MAIYRGPGGSGDAVNDASSETRLAVEARDAAIAAKTAAEAAQAAAELAETNAETAEANAETAETNAETAATSAASSASSASSSASSASSSATAAAASATDAAESLAAIGDSLATAEGFADDAEASATAAASSASSASSSASAASSSASSASSSASAASSSASSASTSASNAATSATNAANSATAAQTAETNAETAESNAETAQAAAELAASNASISASNASASASAAATSATNASNSASSASTSASNASSSATAAANAQTAAETARDQTLTAYDNFDDRYLGAKTSDPTLDNDGDALVAGALYFNSSLGYMKVYTGSVWVDAYAAGTSFLAKANNLSDLQSVSTARTNLGLGTAATTNSTDYATAAQGANADTAYGWGDHALEGYLTSYTETDPVYVASTWYSTTNNSSNWDTAYSWGNHASAGYATYPSQTGNSGKYLTTDGTNTSWDALATVANSGAYSDLSGTPTLATVATSGSYNDLSDKPTIPTDLDSLTDVTITSPSTDQVLKYNGTAWVNGTGGSSQWTTTGSDIYYNTGNVGIGTSSPSTKLDTYSSGTTSTVIRTRNDTTSVYLDANNGYSYLNTFSNHPMLFGTNNTERMRIDSSGNVGIGTTSPDYKFTAISGATAGIGRFGNNNGNTLIETVSGVNRLTSLNAAQNDSQDFAFNGSGGTEFARIKTTGDFQFNSGYGSVATAYGCRAWVNFNGTGTVAIRDSKNVSSITDNATGDYTVNFTNAFPDANYSVSGIVNDLVTTAVGAGLCGVSLNPNAAPTTTTARIFTKRGGVGDMSIVCIQVFR